MTELRVDRLSVHARGKPLLTDIGATMAAGKITAIVGPNGAGKSTLLRALAAIVPAGGQMRLGDVDIAKLKPALRARQIAYLPQTHELAWDISVADMVALGRFAFGGVPGRLSPEDRAAVARAMDQLECAALASRRVTSLSGGEQALACLARVLAADTPVLLADEPVAALDPANQYRVMECLASLAKSGRTVVVVLHDLSLVAQFADEIVWLAAGTLAAHGPATRAELARHIPAVFSRTPGFPDDRPSALFFRREA